MCSNMGTGTTSSGGSTLNAEQRTAYNQYMDRISDSASRVKIERIKSLYKEDGVFLSDEQLNNQIGEALATEEMDSKAVKASVDRIRFTSVPDSKGYADVEIEFKPVETYHNVGKYQLGGESELEKRTKKLPRKSLNIKVMNT